MKQNFMQMFKMFNSFHLVPRLEVRMSGNWVGIATVV